MNRRTLLLSTCLLLALAFAGWQWLRPYQTGIDPAARFEIAHASLTRDHSNLWLDLYLKHRGGDPHDFSKPVELVTGDRRIEPASTTLEGTGSTSAIGLRFWLEQADLAGPLVLRINDGTLRIRRGSGSPLDPDEASRHFFTSRW